MIITFLRRSKITLIRDNSLRREKEKVEEREELEEVRINDGEPEKEEGKEMKKKRRIKGEEEEKKGGKGRK